MNSITFEKKIKHVGESLFIYIYLYYIVNFLNNILWFDYIKIDLFGIGSHHQFWWKNNEFKLEKNFETI